MRKGTSLILAFGILATWVTVTAAQVGFESSRRSAFDEPASPKRKVMQYFSRSNKKRASTPSVQTNVKNFHQELFGTPAPKQSYKRSSVNSVKRSPLRHTPSGVHHASATRPTAKTGNKLVHAEFLQKPTKQKNVIQQTAGNDADTPFNPFERFGSESHAPSAPKPRGIVRKPVQRENNIRRNTTIPPAPVVQRTALEEKFNPFSQPPVPTNSVQNKLALPALAGQNTKQKNTEVPFDMDVRSSRGSKMETVQVSIGWEKKGTINVGQECELELIVKNESDVTARNLSVDAYFPKNVRLTKASPMPREEQDHITWAIPSMKPQETKRISISLIPGQPGDLAVKAFVRLTGTSTGLFAINEPKLKLNVTGPQKVLLGESAAHTIVVSNPGTGVTESIHVEAVLSQGLQHAKGSRVSLNIGSLNPGESRKIHLALATVDGGLQQIDVIARTSSEMTRSASSKVLVVAPSLALNVTGPKLRYKGRNAVYRVVVKNTGKVSTNNVRVMYKVPENFQFVQADKSGKFSRQSRLVDWFIGQLGIGETTTLNIKLKATELGTKSHEVSAISEEGAHAKTAVTTKVDGTASLVLEIVDLDDPVEVGSETAYEVRVKNDGSKAATKVQISCVLPKDVSLIGAKGPTKSYSEKNQIIFQEIPTLAPGKTALFRIHVKGKVEGNRRFRVRLNSTDMDEPLLFEELTKFYGE